jgi:hypothetical protein
MPEARTPSEDSVDSVDLDRTDEPTGSEDDGGYDGPDPETDPKGDRSDEDQGT